MLYYGGVYGGGNKLLKRNGYADMVNHYAEDGTYPLFDIIVYAKTFDEEEACADIVELYNALVAGKSEDKFSISVFYTSSDDTERGVNIGYEKVRSFERYFNPDNFLADIDLSYNAKGEDDWRNLYPSLTDFIKAEIKKGRVNFEERVKDGYFDR